MGILRDIVSVSHRRRGSRCVNIKQIRAWWDARPELEQAVARIEADAMEQDTSPDEIRERTRAYLDMTGADLPCPMDEFLRDWIL